MYLGRVGPGLFYLLSTAFCYAAVGLLVMDANRTGEAGRNGGSIAVFMVLGLVMPLISTFGAAAAHPRSR